MIRSRVLQLRHALRAKHLDALFVTTLANIRYLTGFSGSNALLIVKKSSAIFLTDFRYDLLSKEQISGCKRIVTQIGLGEAAAGARALTGCPHVGFESTNVSYAQYRNLKKLFPRVSFHPTADVIEDLAQRKDDSEIASIRKAAEITDRVYDEILPLIVPGVRELELAAEISFRHKRHGADHDAFETIVASGTRGALPHAKPTAKKIETGELVTIDFGCVVDGYHSDLTRTVAVGDVAPRLREMYDVVLRAQEEAIRAARAGMAARELDAVARRSITAAGYGKYFTHSLGHGVGLHIHERPRVSALSKETLAAGNVVTIEPGVYVPDLGGVRIEDDIVLHRDGCEVITRAPKAFTRL